jgi:tRNA (guanine37-N1)-methyltransferase
MVMQCEPLYRCLQEVQQGQPVHTVLMSPQGGVFDQEKARELLAREHIILVCGHYEGVDQRFVDACVDEEISIGDYVLTGGELAALVVTDSVARMLPGVLADEVCFTDESHYAGLLEYPQYTRPAVWREQPVPQVLLNGDHGKIAQWRAETALERTRQKRPDLLQPDVQKESR